MLARSATISIAMDERNDRLLVTYVASKRTNVNSGVLAQIRSPGRTADEVAGCVAKAVRRLCTRRAPQKHTYTPKEPPRLVEAAARRVLQHVEMFSADGAANEQLAGRLLHPAVERAGTADKLPNLKMILRDKAHAARRLTQRTFKVDPLLDDLQRTMLFGVEDARGGSVAKMLRDSGPCADIFKKEVERQQRREGLAGVVTHLGYAKQRFDNTAKPLAVAVWNLDAVISSCDLIARDSAIRKQFRRVAETFLTMLSPETILLLGMLADASDEVLVLVRFFDKEAFEVDRMAEAVETFKRQLSALFRGQVCLRTGFTQLCLKRLHTTKLVRLGNGALRTVCGPAVDVKAVVQKCLQRMVAWARLVEEVVSTEFPAWELLGGIQCLPIGGCADTGASASAPGGPGIGRLRAAAPARPCGRVQRGWPPARGGVPGSPEGRSGNQEHAPGSILRGSLAGSFGQDATDPEKPGDLASPRAASSRRALLCLPWLDSWDRADIQRVQADDRGAVACLRARGGAAPRS